MKAKVSMVTILLAIMFMISNASGSGLKQMWLTSDPGNYIGGSTDPWLADSVLISESPFTLDITNHLPQAVNDIDGLYLIIAANRDPRGSGGINVAVNSAEFSDGGSVVPIIYQDWTQVSGDDGVTLLGYKTSPHGILTAGTWYRVIQVDPPAPTNSKYLIHDQQNDLYVNFAISSPNSNDRIHIDSVGTRMESQVETGFAGNPYSHDVTWQVPEFPTIALPIAAALAIMFIMRGRKKEE